MINSGGNILYLINNVGNILYSSLPYLIFIFHKLRNLYLLKFLHLYLYTKKVFIFKHYFRKYLVLVLNKSFYSNGTYIQYMSTFIITYSSTLKYASRKILILLYSALAKTLSSAHRVYLVYRCHNFSSNTTRVIKVTRFKLELTHVIDKLNSDSA